MASLFNITTAANSITLDARRMGKTSFTVSNISTSSVRARARVMSPDASILPWFTIDGEAARVLAPAETEQYAVSIAAPPTAIAKDYTFSLLLVDEALPDENYTEGPAVKLTVPPPIPVPAKKPFPWWIVAVAVVAVIIVIAAIVAVVNQNNQAQANATATQNAINTATIAANSIATQTAAAIQTQTAAAALTQTALANTRASQTAAALTQTALAVIHATQTAAAIPNQDIMVANGAGVVAFFTVSYDFAGARQTQNSGSIPLGADSTVTIPGLATNVDVTVSFSGSGQTCSRHYDQARSVTIFLSGIVNFVSCTGG